MSRTLGSWTLTFALTASFTGCSTEQKSGPATDAQPAAESAADVHPSATEKHTNADEDSAEITQALAKLSPEDRALAEKQKICPVTEEPLGSMGAPIKVAVEGREVFVCCEGCVDELKNNFAKYEEKLPEA
jgi:hypothetical protein